VFLKRHVIHKDDKEHVYYSLGESVRLSAQRVIQRRLLSLGELNTTQLERWQRSIEVIQQDGGSRQYRLFTDQDGAAPPDGPDVCEVVLSSLAVRHPRQFGACWARQPALAGAGLRYLLCRSLAGLPRPGGLVEGARTAGRQPVV
jgi:hypothetical protein